VWALTSIEVEKLREVTEALLRHLTDSVGDVVNIESEYFWSIPPEALYDPFNGTRDLTMGQVSDSWKNLESIRSNPERAINYGLVWLADIAREIGHQTIG
jgi:hypothetical protein